jgi:hypothetical protein
MPASSGATGTFGTFDIPSRDGNSFRPIRLAWAHRICPAGGGHPALKNGTLSKRLHYGTPGFERP